MTSRLVRALAWCSLLAVAIVTLAPIGLRPETTLPPSVERMTAFAIIGLLFTIAYPRKFWLAVLVTFGAAIALELLQVLAPSRHGRGFDAVVKLAGGGFGLLIGYLGQRLRELVPRG
jgi:hypothetical protein